MNNTCGCTNCANSLAEELKLQQFIRKIVRQEIKAMEESKRNGW